MSAFQTKTRHLINTCPLDTEIFPTFDEEYLENERNHAEIKADEMMGNAEHLDTDMTAILEMIEEDAPKAALAAIIANARTTEDDKEFTCTLVENFLNSLRGELVNLNISE